MTPLSSLLCVCVCVCVCVYVVLCVVCMCVICVMSSVCSQIFVGEYFSMISSIPLGTELQIQAGSV
jgi:hypothetical protein